MDYSPLNVRPSDSLQEALEALPPEGGAIHLCAGTHVITRTVRKQLAEGQHLYLYGDGRASVLRNAQEEGEPLLQLCGVAGSWWPDLRMTVRDLCLVGTAHSGSALVIDYPNDTMVDSCVFLGHGGNALCLGPQGTNVTVRDCWLRDCRRGLRADNIHHLTFQGNQTRSLAGGQEQAEHVYLGWECREVRLIGNHLAYGQAQAIVLNGTAQHVITANTIEGFRVGIEAHGRGETAPPDRCRDLVISGNYLHADTGILLQGEVRGFTIQGNNIINNPGAAVRVEGEGGGGHTISGNTIRKSVYDGVYVKTADPRQGGIDLGAATNCCVTGNVLEGVNPGPAIRAAGGGHLVSGNVLARCEGQPWALAEGSEVSGNKVSA